VLDVGLVAPRGELRPEDALRRLGIEENDRRTRVYVGLRAAVHPDTLRRAAEASPNCLFLHLGADDIDSPGNVLGVPPGAGLAFPDIVAISHTVVSKLGYGIVSTCVASGVGLLFPPRVGFREDVGLRAGARRYLRSRELPIDDFHGGDWAPHLRALHGQPRPAETLAPDGASRCAAMIAAESALR
jgi:hypothetical protein